MTAIFGHLVKQVQDVVGHPALVITRNVEWGTVIFGFEQANKYTIYDQQGNVVALLAEELGSFGKEVGRQLLRTRRPFTATVFSPDGEPSLSDSNSYSLSYTAPLSSIISLSCFCCPPALVNAEDKLFPSVDA